MSLPVTRRIARAALLVAAGAAPVVAAAGSASAVDLPAKAPDLGGVTTLDSANTSKTLDSTARDGVALLNEAGGKAATELAPALVKTAGPIVHKASPLTQRTADTAEGLLGKTAKKGVSTDSLPTDAAQGALGNLPVNGLLGGLPIGG
jgi:hypothetical protein